MRGHMCVLLMVVTGICSGGAGHARTRIDTYWYRVAVRVDRASLPPGVVVKVKRSAFADLIALRWNNRSSKPLLIIKRLSRPLRWPRVLPANALPLYKLVDNQAFEWTNEGWRRDGKGISTDSLFAALHLRPFEREFKQRPQPKGKQTIIRKINIPYYAKGKQYALTGTVEFDVDFGRNAQLKSREHFDPIPTPGQLVRKTGWVPWLANPSSQPVYFAVKYPQKVEWVGRLPANEVPCYRLQSGQVAHTVAPALSMSRDRRAVSGGWYQAPKAGSVARPLGWFAELAGVKLHLMDDFYRPRKVAVPKAQMLRIPVRYDGKQHVVRVTVSYAINRAFKGRIRDSGEDR